MASRQVTRTEKTNGDITGLCGSGWKVNKTQAIRDIESGTHRYFVHEVAPPVNVTVVNGPSVPVVWATCFNYG